MLYHEFAFFVHLFKGIHRFSQLLSKIAVVSSFPFDPIHSAADRTVLRHTKFMADLHQGLTTNSS